MAPRSSGNAKGAAAEPLQQKVSELDKSQLPLQQKLQGAQSILTWNKPHSHNDSSPEASNNELDVPLPILKWLLRWLLKQLDETCSDNTALSVQVDFWKLFNAVALQLPSNSLAQSLKHGHLLQYLDKSVQLCLQFAPTEAASDPDHPSSDGVHDGIESWSKAYGVSVSSPLKRKRDEDNAMTPIGSTLHSDRNVWKLPEATTALFFEVSKLLQQLVYKSEGSSEAIPTCEEEFVKEIFPRDSQIVASLFSDALRFVRRLKVESHHSSGGNSPLQNADTLLRPFMFCWTASSTAGQDVEAEQAGVFCTECLPNVISLLPILRRGNELAACQQLEDLVHRMAISPAKRKYLTVKRPKQKLENTSFLVEFFDSLLGDSPSDKIYDEGQGSSVQEPLAVVFDLALRKLPENIALRAPADEEWLCVLFEYFDMVSASRQEKSWQTTTREMLRLAQQKNLRLSTPTLETIIERILQRDVEDDLAPQDWEIVGLCIGLDQSLALVRSHSDVTEAVQKLLAHTINVTSQPIHSLHTHCVAVDSTIRAPVDHFILPLLRYHVQARQFDKFITCWHGQLSAARLHIAQCATGEAPGKPVHEDLALSVNCTKSVWEDAAVVSAVRSFAPEVLLQIAESVSNLTKDLTSPQGDDEDSSLYSSSFILYALLGSPFVDEAIDQLENSAQDVRDRITKALYRIQLMTPCVPLLWGTLSTVLERWPQLYMNWKPEHRLKIINLAKTAIQEGDQNTHRNRIGGKHQALVYFSAFAFLWGLANIQGSTAEEPDLDALDLTREAAGAVSKLDERHSRSDQGDKPANETQLQEHYLAILAKNPLPFLYVRNSSREEQLGELTRHIAGRAANIASISDDKLISNSLARSWLTHERFEVSKELMSAAQTASMNIALGNIKREEANASWALGSLDPKVWTKRESRILQQSLIEAILEYQPQSRSAFPQSVVSLLAHCMGKPLSTSDETHLRLRQLLEKELSAITETTAPLNIEKATTVEGLRRVLGHESETRSKPAAQLKSMLTPSVSMQAAGRTFTAFKEAFEGAEAIEKADTIQELLKMCTMETQLPLLIFARKACSANYPKEQQTEEVKTALQDLVSQLFVIALESRDMRRVLLALKSVTAAFAKNPWAIGQPHIDLCLACASQIPTRQGSRTTKTVSTEVAEDGPKVNGDRRPRARLDLASARRMVFGSLAVRNPKTKDDEMKVRRQLVGRSGAPVPNGTAEAKQKEPAAPTTEEPEEELDPTVPSALYTALCSLLASTLRSFRARTGGRWHLVIDALRSLLGCLFTPYTAPTTSDTPWLRGSELTAANASDFARLLTLLCDPTVSSVQTSKRRDEQSAALHDATRRARRDAGEHMPPLVKEYCALRLRGQFDADKRTALTPGLYAVFDAMNVGPEANVVRVLNETLTRQEREIFRASWDEYLRFGKWKGG